MHGIDYFNSITRCVCTECYESDVNSLITNYKEYHTAFYNRYCGHIECFSPWGDSDSDSNSDSDSE